MFELRVNGRQGRVLVVEDEAGVRKPIRQHLVKAGYEVVEAEDGDVAIKRLNEGENPLMVDTILCDVRMPKMNGADAIAYFRSQHPCVPIVVLTGYPDIDLATSLLRQGVLDYLVKPVTMDRLLPVIKRAVDQHEILKNQFTT